MKQDFNYKKRMSLLGFCAGNTPLVMEAARESMQITGFDIVKNVEVDIPESIFSKRGIDIDVCNAEQYNFEHSETGMHFGVLDAHLKYIVYYLFLKHYAIKKERYSSIIHPKSYVAGSASYESGLLLDPMAVVTSEAKIGFAVTIKRSSSVGHHVTVGDFTTINPGAIIAGNVSIGKGATIGAGATIIQNISIGEKALIGAGSVVTKDIPDGVVAYGNPCRVVRKNESWIKTEERLNNML